MAWTGNYVPTSFKRDLLKAQHDFSASGGHTFKMALYDENATFNAATTDYTGTNEIANGNGYTTGGLALTNIEPTIGATSGFCDFEDAVWTGTITARGALIYNTTTAGGVGTTDAVLILDFGSNRSVVSGNFTVRMPTADELNAILRIGP